MNVVEYSEITPEERDAREPDGSLKHPNANISLLSFKMDFIEQMARDYDQMPFHLAWKAVKSYSPEGETRTMAWKFEKFIFDVLPFAKRIEVFLSPRELCFAPLKNAEGADSIVTVQAALQRSDRKIFEKISGVEPSESRVFELDPQFYYPTQEIVAKWQGKSLPDASYIEP